MGNGCSFAGPKDEPAQSCCNVHDHKYYRGGFIAKFKSDIELFRCIVASNPTPGVLGVSWRIMIAIVMYCAISTFGWFWWIKYGIRRYLIARKVKQKLRSE